MVPSVTISAISFSADFLNRILARVDEQKLFIVSQNNLIYKLVNSVWYDLDLGVP